MSAPQPFRPDNLRPDGRDALGRFGPGNPGKPVGARSKNQVSRAALTAVQGLSSLAILKLRERIDAGDMQAIRLCLEFTLPRNGRAIELDSADPSAWADALAHGEISPDEAARAAQALAKLSDVAEMEDLRKRLDELETALADRRQ